MALAKRGLPESRWRPRSQGEAKDSDDSSEKLEVAVDIHRDPGRRVIGIDLVSIVEFQRELDLGGEGFLRKAFTDSELENRQVTHMAGLWAAKEAVAKAAGLPVTKLTDVGIIHDALGRPRGTLGTHHFELSISHHGDYAVAVALMVAT